MPGCTIVLYFDGLIERRDTDLCERLAELEATVGDLDDVAILVVKLRGTPLEGTANA